MPLSSCISFSRMGAVSIENEEGSYDSSFHTSYPVSQKGQIHIHYKGNKSSVQNDTEITAEFLMYECGSIQESDSFSVLGHHHTYEYPVQFDASVCFDNFIESISLITMLGNGTKNRNGNGSLGERSGLARGDLFIRERKNYDYVSKLNNTDMNMYPCLTAEISKDYQIHACITNRTYRCFHKTYSVESPIIEKELYLSFVPFSNFYRPDQKFQLYRTKDNVVLAEWNWDEWKIFAVNSNLTVNEIKEYIALHQLYLEWYRLINSREWYGLPKAKAGEYQAKRLVAP